MSMTHAPTPPIPAGRQRRPRSSRYKPSSTSLFHSDFCSVKLHLYIMTDGAQLRAVSPCCACLILYRSSTSSTRLLMQMNSPTRYMSQLTINDMPSPRLRSPSPDPDMDFGPLDEDDDTILSPSRLLYSMRNLDHHQRDGIIETFFTEDIDAFQMVLHDYSLLEDKAKFEVLELTRHTISIPARHGSDSHGATCNKCRSGAHECRAGLWLLDQIAGQVLGDSGEPLAMTANGYPEELGDLFEAITDHDIDILANGLQFNDTYRAWGPVPRRVQESREILASLHDTPVSMYRSDLFGPGDDDDDDIIQKNDLEKTVFRMLLHNDQFFKYFLSTMKPDMLVNNRFRKLQHKADYVLAKFLAKTDGSSNRSRLDRSRSGLSRHVRWCAKSLNGIINQIQFLLSSSSRPLEDWELDSAARALIHILAKLVDLNGDSGQATTSRREQNVLVRLISDGDGDFIVGILDKLVPRDVLALHEEDLIDIQEKLHGAPQSWYVQLADLIDMDRRTRAIAKEPSSLKRVVEGGGPRAKRAK